MNEAHGNHVALARWMMDAGGQSRFEDAIIPYTRTHGPLKQSGVIEASEIRFHRWPGGFTGHFKTASKGMLFLAMDGTVSIEAGDGEVRTFQTSDVLEITSRTGTEINISVAQGQPFSAAVVLLQQGPDGRPPPKKACRTLSMPPARTGARILRTGHGHILGSTAMV